jgi:putative heme-binding domain-containing protein
LAWQILQKSGTAAEKSLSSIFNDATDQRMRARAFWLLAKLPGKEKAYIVKALKDKNEDIRTAALKAARQSGMDVIPFVKQVMNDASPHVRREILMAIRHSRHADAPGMWAQLAQKYDGKDRWYLEALGVSADQQWDRYFDAWVKTSGNAWMQPAGRDIVWRSRSQSALPLLAKIIQDQQTDPAKNLKLFRAFDFHSGPAKQEVLLSLLNGNHPQQKMITVFALIQLDTANLAITPSLRSTISNSLQTVKGTQEFLDLVSKYKITDQNNELLNIALNSNKADAKSTAVRLLMNNNGASLVESAIKGDNNTAMNLVTALGSNEDVKIKDLLQSVLLNPSLDLKVRQRATQMFYNGWNGQERLMTLVSEKKLPAELDTTAEKLLVRSWRQDIKQKAMAHYNRGNTAQQTLQPLASLASLNGNPEAGKALFNGTCTVCHQVNNVGTNFGPDLSGIGSKLSKEALYKAVLYPDEGISFGYEGFIFKTKDGNQVLGYITSETEDDLSVKMMGGTVVRIKKTDLVSKKAYEHSLMPAGLVSGMKEQQVVDLIEYMARLGKK